MRGREVVFLYWQEIDSLLACIDQSRCLLTWGSEACSVVRDYFNLGPCFSSMVGAEAGGGGGGGIASMFEGPASAASETGE